MLKHGEVNPLNVFGLRRLDFCPPHFTQVKLAAIYVDQKQITDWIYENLAGRFCFIDDYHETDFGGDQKFVEGVKCAGFEDPSEASLFMLMKDQVNPMPRNIFPA